MPEPALRPVPASRTAKRLASAIGCVIALGSGAVTAELTQASQRTQPAAVAVTEGVAPTGMVRDVVDGPPVLPAPTTPENVPAPTDSPSDDDVELVDVSPLLPTSADAVSSNLRDGRVITGATPHRFILFTFDDGPDVRYTRALLDALDAAEIRALFFLTARRFQGPTPYERGLADIAREIVARGHRVGSHTMDHIQLPLVSTPDLTVQVEDSAAVIERELGAPPALIRPPGGSRSPRVDGYIAERGFTQVLWNLGTGDVVVRSADEVLTTFRGVLWVRERDHGERGGIVLLHDIHAWSVEAFPRIVAYLDRRNCELLERGEELYDFVDDPALFFEARAEGDAPDAEAHAELPAALVARRQIRARARAEARCADLAALDAAVAGD